MKQKEWYPEDFFHVLSTHTEQRKLMREIPLLKFVGMLKVNTEHVRDVCLPYPMKVLNSVYQKLPKMANPRNEDLLSVVRVSFFICHFFLYRLCFASAAAPNKGMFCEAVKNSDQEVNNLFP